MTRTKKLQLVEESHLHFHIPVLESKMVGYAIICMYFYSNEEEM